MAEERTITLRTERDAGGSRFLGVRLTMKGDLVVEGQDLGASVEAFWGTGNREYEWALTVRAANVPRLLEALGGQAGDDVLALVGERFAGPRASELERFIKEREIPTEFWSRVGD